MASKSSFKFPDSSVPVPFKPELEEDFLSMTLQKVASHRPTEDLGGDWSDEGPPSKKVMEIASDWLTKFSWRTFEAKMQSDYHHFATTVPANEAYSLPVPLHFIHHRSEDSSATPLILLHGWPSSFLEWSKVVGPLSKSFHIVAPDLPGFGFSPAPRKPMSPKAMALAFKDLMNQLGYEKYGIISTDLGWTVGLWMLGPQILGHFCDFYILPPSPADRARRAANQTTEEENNYIAAIDNWFTKHWAYGTVHEQKPLAIAHALNDTPVGLLSWILDLNYAISDGHEYSSEEIITDTMMLWIPGIYHGLRLYHESSQPSSRNYPQSDVPTAVTQWSFEHGPYEDLANVTFVPEEWLKRHSNIAYFARHASGGHFPALTSSDEFIEDVTAFFKSLNN